MRNGFSIKKVPQKLRRSGLLFAIIFLAGLALSKIVFDNTAGYVFFGYGEAA